MAAAGVVAALSLSACAGGSGGSAGTLTLASQLTPVSFAADGANWGSESIYEQAAYDTLLHADADTAAPLPALATKWTISADKKTYTFTLRSDVKFSDGTTFDASAAAQNILRFKAGTATQASTLGNVAGAKAINPTTLQLTLSQPDPAILSYLSQAPGLMESPKAFGNANVKTVPVGSGPYTMDVGATVTGTKYVFKKNPNYWDKSQHLWSKLVINVLSTPQAQVTAIKGKQVDGANLTDPSIYKAVASAGYTLVKHQTDWQGLIIADKTGKQVPAFKSLQVRQAMSYAIDSKALLKAQALNEGTITRQIFPTYSPGYDPSLDSAYPYNPTKAKQLLAAAGYSHFSFTIPQVPGYGQVANNLVKQYLGAVGITVNLQTIPQADFITDLQASKFPAYFIGFQEDPVAFQEANFLLTPNATFNTFHYTDPKVVALVKTIQTGSTTAANAATKQLNDYTVTNAWNVVWYRVNSAYGTSSKVTAKAQAGNVIPYLYNIAPKSK